MELGVTSLNKAFKIHIELHSQLEYGNGMGCRDKAIARIMIIMYW